MNVKCIFFFFHNVLHIAFGLNVKLGTQANKEQRNMLLESVVYWPLRMDFKV